MDWKKQFEMYLLEKHWKEALGLMQGIIREYPDDVNAWVHVIYLLYEVLDEDYPITQADRKEMTRLVLQYFNESYKRFSENAEYLSFVGGIVGMAPWYCGLEYDEPEKMRLKALKLEPSNRLYQWSAFPLMGGKKNYRKAIQLAQQIIKDNGKEIEWLLTKGLPGKEEKIRGLESWSHRDEKWIEEVENAKMRSSHEAT